MKSIGARTSTFLGKGSGIGFEKDNTQEASSMTKYIAKRVLRSLITMLIIITVLFALLRMMPIEGYFENYDKMTEVQIQAKLNTLGLNDPLPIQLMNFYKQLLQGDLVHPINTGSVYPSMRLSVRRFQSP